MGRKGRKKAEVDEDTLSEHHTISGDSIESFNFCKSPSTPVSKENALKVYACCRLELRLPHQIQKTATTMIVYSSEAAAPRIGSRTSSNVFNHCGRSSITSRRNSRRRNERATVRQLYATLLQLSQPHPTDTR